MGTICIINKRKTAMDSMEKYNGHKTLYLVSSTKGMGGTERLFDNCIHNKEFFNNVIFCCFYPPIDKSLLMFYKNNGVVLLSRQRWPYLSKILLQYPIIMSKMISLIKTNNIRIVHVHDNLGMLFVVAAKLFVNIRVIRTFHGAVDNYLQLEHICYRFLRRWVYQAIFVSESFMKLYAKINQMELEQLRGRLVYNGIRCNGIEINKAFRHPRNRFRFIMVGNYTGGRDQLFIIKTFQNVLHYFPDSSLWLIGNYTDGKESEIRYSQCVDYSKSNNIDNIVKFVQNVTDVFPYLTQSDVFIYESTRDTFGIAIVEAMMCGLPCIVNDLDVFQEISNDGEFAVLFKTGDIDDCVEKTLSVLNSYEYHKERAMSNISKVREKYSMERYAKNLNEVYQEAARGM